jgi:two-component sensor histidine kinase
MAAFRTWDGQFRSFGKLDGMVDEHVAAIHEDSQGILWLGTRSGVLLYDGANWTSIDTRDGLAGNSVMAIDEHPDGHLFFGTDGGLTRYLRSTQVPRARFTGLQAERSYEGGEPLTAGHRITVHAESVDFQTVADKRLFRFRIEEVDDAWRPATHGSTFEWTPQHSGSYTVLAQSIDRDLNYSSPARLQVTVVSPWHLNPWIVLPGALGILLLIAISATSSVRYYAERRRAEAALRQSHEQLEHQVKERTQGLQAEIVVRRRAEAQLTASVEEKEVLLKEIHHRVKNNMQVVSSMLNLQASGLHEDVRRLFDDSSRRIRSMALVHEHLYGSTNLSSINLRSYLEQLTSGLIAASSEHRALNLDSRIEEIWVHIDTAIPCGLIVSELVSNALKHAYDVDGGQRLTVTLRKQAEGRCELSVEDDGVGMPPGLDFHQSGTLGLRLVAVLTGQIGGQIDCRSERGKGTTFVVNWPEIRPESPDPDVSIEPTGRLKDGP